jgi:hypothetical protein
MRIPIIIVWTILIAVNNATAQTALKTIGIVDPMDTLIPDKDLNPEWMQHDQENLKNIFSLLDNQEVLKQENQFLKSIINLDIRDTKDLGFGLTFYECAQYGGYVTTWISLLSFENKIIQYDIRYKEDDFKIIDYLIRHDRQLGSAISFVVDTLAPFGFYYQDTLAFARFKINVASKSGPMKLLAGKSDEKVILNFSILTNPINSYDYGTSCYESGVAPEGRTAINYFVHSNNIPVIREVIKGYNPEGRLYAIEALLIAANEGKTILTNEDKKLIKDILSLNIPISSCRGCLVSKSTANELLDEKLKAILTK